MKFALAVACLMVLAMVHGAPQAGPQPIDESKSSSNCKVPPCPVYRHVNLPYLLDCVRYLECNEGVATVRTCPPGQHFTEHGHTCVDAKVANCVPCGQTVSP